MQIPTKKQTDKFLDYLSGLEKFVWIHEGNIRPDPDLVIVVNWLKNWDVCPLCDGLGERVWNDGFLHPCSCKE